MNSPDVAPSLVAKALADIARNAARICGANDALILQVDSDSFRPVAKHGRALTARNREIFRMDRDTVYGRAVLDRRTIHVPVLTPAGSSPSGARRGQRTAGARTMLVAPLQHKGRAIGVIVIRRTRVRPFAPKQIMLLKSFADQAAIVIDHARLSAEVVDRDRQLDAKGHDLTDALQQQAATSEILRVISGTLTDVGPVFEIIAENAARVCAASDAVVALREGESLILKAHHGTIPVTSPIVGTRRPISRDWVGGRAMSDGRTVHVEDILAVGDEFPLGFERGRIAGHRTVLATPLLHDRQTIGVLIIRRTEVRPFTRRQIALLETFAAQAVIAIENVRLFKELETRNRDLTETVDRQTATAEVLRVISSSPTDLGPVFDSIIKSAIRLSGASMGGIFQFDGRIVERVGGAGPQTEQDRPQPFSSPPDRGFLAGRAILERQAVQTPDALDDPEYESKDFARRMGWRGGASVPMLRDGVPVGAITVARAEPGLFSETVVGLLQTFADQAVIAIENVRLFRELGARNADLAQALDHQTATAEILRAISQAQTDVQPVFEAISDSVMRLFGAWSAGVFRYDGELIQLVAARGGLPGSSRSMMARYVAAGRPPEETVPGRTVITRAVQHVVDVELDASWGVRLRDDARMRGFRSVVSVPMLRGNDAVGVIAVTRAEAGGFTPAEIALLQTFADQAVIAVENVRLLAELQAKNLDLTEALNRQTATAEILRLIGTSPTDAQPVFEGIARSGVQVCGALGCSVFVVDGDMLQVAATHGVRPERIAKFREEFPIPLAAETDITRRVRERQMFHLADIENNPAATALMVEHARLGGYRTRLMLPMMRGENPLGMIAITREAPAPFSDREIDLLRTFADQAVIAIENVRLFKELEARTRELTQSVEQLTALGEVGHAVSSTLHLQAVLDTIVTRAVELSGTDGGLIYEYDEASQEFHLRATHHVDDELVAALRRAPVHLGEGATGRAAALRTPVQVIDIAADQEYSVARLRPLFDRLGYRSLLSVPLLFEHRIIGALVVWRHHAGAFSHEIVNLLQTFASQSCLAINNARLFREIEDKSRLLEVASRHKSQFLANMSHELRTPLNAILGYTELIVDGTYGAVPERMREILDRVEKSGRHLLGLINDILDLSKIEAGQLKLVPIDYSMEDVVRSVAASTEALAAAKELALVVTVAPDMPLGWGDARRLNQVLLNLVGNAIKFTEAGRVSVDARAADGTFVVAVADTGPGIGESERERIFEEFQQAETTIRGAKGGTGLGLAISRRIVEMHGGRLWVESTLGQGSTFTFTVPVRAEGMAVSMAEAR